VLYNFCIITLGHFCCKSLRKTRSNRATPKCFHAGTCSYAMSRAGRRQTAHSRPWLGPDTEALLRPPVLQPSHRCLRAQYPVATRRTPMGRANRPAPPNQRHHRHTPPVARHWPLPSRPRRPTNPVVAVPPPRHMHVHQSCLLLLHASRYIKPSPFLLPAHDIEPLTLWNSAPPLSPTPPETPQGPRAPHRSSPCGLLPPPALLLTGAEAPATAHPWHRRALSLEHLPPPPTPQTDPR
jgi:hypothetical protein